MKVHELMSSPVKSVQADATIQEASRKMREFDIGALPVFEGPILRGIVTDRDLTVRTTAEGLDPRMAAVGLAATWGVESCRDDQDVEEAAWIMKTKKIRRLPVLDAAGELVGILALSDVVNGTHDAALIDEVVEAIMDKGLPAACGKTGINIKKEG